MLENYKATEEVSTPNKSSVIIDLLTPDAPGLNPKRLFEDEGGDFMFHEYEDPKVLNLTGVNSEEPPDTQQTTNYDDSFAAPTPVLPLTFLR